MHVVADCLQQIGNRRAVGGTAPVTDVQRTGRVGRDELYLHTASTADVAAAVGRAGREYFRDQRLIRRRSEKEIDKSGTRNLGVSDEVRGGQVLDNLLRELTWRDARQVLQDQSGISREIAMAFLPRPLKLQHEAVVARQYALLRQLAEGILEQLAQAIFHDVPSRHLACDNWLRQ